MRTYWESAVSKAVGENHVGAGDGKSIMLSPHK